MLPVNLSDDPLEKKRNKPLSDDSDESELDPDEEKECAAGDLCAIKKPVLRKTAPHHCIVCGKRFHGRLCAAWFDKEGGIKGSCKKCGIPKDVDDGDEDESLLLKTFYDDLQNFSSASDRTPFVMGIFCSLSKSQAILDEPPYNNKKLKKKDYKPTKILLAKEIKRRFDDGELKMKDRDDSSFLVTSKKKGKKVLPQRIINAKEEISKLIQILYDHPLSDGNEKWVRQQEKAYRTCAINMISDTSSVNSNGNENASQRISNSDRMRLTEVLLHEDIKHLIRPSQETLTWMELDGRNSKNVLKYNYYYQVALKLNSPWVATVRAYPDLGYAFVEEQRIPKTDYQWDANLVKTQLKKCCTLCTKSLRNTKIVVTVLDKQEPNRD